MDDQYLQRKRNPWLASILMLFGGLIGFAYVGRLRAGCALIAFQLLLIAVAGWSGLFLSVAGFLAVMFVVISTAIVVLVLALKFAIAGPTFRRPYQRWYVYALLGVFSWFGAGLLLAHRGPLFGYEFMNAPSTSMVDGIRQGEYMLVDMRSAATAHLKRDDVVIYQDALRPVRYVKRVAALPGESIKADGDELLIDGKPLADVHKYLLPGKGPAAMNGEWRLAENEYFLVGDNRRNSYDSRSFGPIPINQILGRVRVRLSLDDWSRWIEFE